MNKQVADFMKKAMAYVNGTQNFLQKQAKAQEKVASTAPAVAELLVAKGLIEPFQKASAVESLKDHAKALEILKVAVAKIHQAPPSMGGPEKTAATKNVVRKSDEVFVDRLFN